MKISISGRGISVSDALETRVARELDLAIGRFSYQIERVTVKLTDLCDAVRVEDKLCRIRVRLHSRHSVIVEAEGAKLDVAIDHAIRGIGSVMASHLKVPSGSG